MSPPNWLYTISWSTCPKRDSVPRPVSIIKRLHRSLTRMMKSLPRAVVHVFMIVVQTLVQFLFIYPIENVGCHGYTDHLSASTPKGFVNGDATFCY